MKWNLNYIQKYAKPSLDFSEEIIFEDSIINKLNGVYGLENITVIGKLKYISSISQCTVDFKVCGFMKMKCAISNEDINYKFEDSDTIVFSFEKTDDDSEIIFAKGNIIDLDPYIWQLIVVNVPLKVVKEGAKLSKSKGKNWQIGDFEEKNEPYSLPGSNAITSSIEADVETFLRVTVS